MKVLSIVGARPQFIKAAVVSSQLMAKGINEVILHTGQHFDDNMSQVFFNEMDIPEPKYNLEIHGLSHGAMTGKMLEGIETVILNEKPDMVLVYGDTNSTIAGALAARKLQVPVAHVEAGLRSFNMRMPEEINRILTDRISNLLFCPTDTAIENLKREGFDNYPCTIHKTGDVMQDAALYFGSISSSKSDIINRLDIRQSFVLATVHRQENTDDPKRLTEIITALNLINRDQRVIVPLHPRTAKFVKELKLEINFTVIPPVGYFDMVELLKNCSMVLTDSGGVQKEAFFFRKCCVTLRQETEWTELVKGGYNMLGSSDSEFILIAYNEMLTRTPDFNIDLYGKGKASERIAEILLKWKG
jgi:UDP-GlcNAc3NAcA epimerase